MSDAGIESIWLPQIFGYDALSLLAIIGREVPNINLGTAVIPVYPRHPIALAAQAVTVQSATSGRLTLGLGLSHKVVIENIFGMSFDQPVRYMREYLSILKPLLEGKPANFIGKTLRGSTFGPLEVTAKFPPPIMIAAMGPKMLELAAQLTCGTITWMTGPSTLESYVIPTIKDAATRAQRTDPKVCVGLPVCVTKDVPAAKEFASKLLYVYGTLPSYRAMLEKEGAAGPVDVSIIGSASEVKTQVNNLAQTGVDEFIGMPFGSDYEMRATIDALGELS